MTDFIIKIEPLHKPRLIECDELTEERMQTEVEGPTVATELCHELRTKHPNIRLVINEDGKLFELKANVIATLLHVRLLDVIYGPAFFIAVDNNGKPRALTKEEAEALRETIESSYDIEFEEGEE